MGTLKTSVRPLSPIKPQERVILLDVLRGFAMLGILFLNSTDGAGIFFPDFLCPDALDRIGYQLIYILCGGKFWPLFAILFGVGFAVQLERAEARNLSIIPIYLRRLFFLVVIGFGLTCFSIDVPQLERLAMSGLYMMFIGYALRRRPVSWLVAVTVALLVIQLSVMIPRSLARDSGISGPPDVDLAEATIRFEKWRETIEAKADKDASWSLDRLNGQELKQTLHYYADMPSRLINFRDRSTLLFFMLVGIFLWRLGVFRDAARRRRFFVWLLAISLPIGLCAAVQFNGVRQAWNLTQFGLGEYPTFFMRLIFWPLSIIGSLGMALTYIASIALLIQHKIGSRVLGIFVPVGRMALTNYALQDLFASLIFGRYLIGIPRLRIPFIAHAVLLLVLFGLQILFSRVWLRAYRFGTLEWLWRSLTYWKPQPMRSRRESPRQSNRTALG
jgi:uncharacterized protein